MALGALLGGAALGGLLGSMGGSNPSMEKYDQYTPEQNAALEELLKNLQPQIGGLLGNLGYDLTGHPSYKQGLEALTQQLSGFNPDRTIESFESNVARPAIQQFQEHIAPTIQERFIGSGAGRSSALGEQLARSGEQLQTNLAGQKAEALRAGEQSAQQRQQQAIMQSLGYAQAPQTSQSQSIIQLLQALGLGLQSQPFGYVEQPGSPSPFAGIAGSFGKASGSKMASYLMGL